MTLPQPTAETMIVRPIWRQAARACVIVAGIFCILMATMLGILWMQEKIHHPLVETATGPIAVLHELLKAHPADESLKEQIRQADAALRQSYWAGRTRINRGAWLLLAGAAILVAGIKALRTLDRPIPQRQQILAPDGSASEMRWAIWTIGGMGGAITLLLLTGAWWSLDHPVITAAENVARAPETPVTTDHLLGQWPAFRGWGGGAARLPDPKVRIWNGPSGQNILWHTSIPLPGASSPIIWNNTVILTGATEVERQIMAFDLGSGKLLWQTAIGGAGPPPEISEQNSLAAPTPVTDGRRAYAIFPTGDIAAVDLAGGAKVWEKNLGKPDSQYGYAASLAIFADGGIAKIIVQWDMGAPEDHRSSLMALDGRSGKMLWQTKRPVGNSWASPLVSKVEGDAIGWQVITAANPWVIGYDAATGKELWRSNVLGGDVAPSPAAADHLGKTFVFAAEEGAARAAIPISNARGETACAWKLNDEGLPDIVSPVSDGRYVWTGTSSGTLYCFDVGTGKEAWEHDFSTDFQATPSLVGAGAGSELWLTDGSGVTHRLAVADEFKELGVNRLGERVAASLAFSNAGGITRIVIRGRKNLYCIGPPSAAAPEAK